MSDRYLLERLTITVADLQRRVFRLETLEMGTAGSTTPGTPPGTIIGYDLPIVNAEFGTSSFPGVLTVNQRPALAFNDAADETAYWTFVVPSDWAGTVTPSVNVGYIMASATSGSVVWAVQVEAITPGDALDLDATNSFDTANVAAAAAVPDTAGRMGTVSIALANADSMAAGDLARLALYRDANHADDTASGDAYALTVEISRSL